MVKVQDIIEFVSGSPQFRIRESIDESAPVYIFYGQPEIEADLIDLEINEGAAKQIKTYDKVNTVESGDILFSLISGKATLVRTIHQNYLFSQNYVKLIPKENINPEYLIYLLNEDTSIKHQFQIGLQGSKVLKYTVKQLKELVLPEFPSLEQQQLIGELYFNQLRLQALRERVAILETTIVLEKLKEVKSNE